MNPPPQDSVSWSLIVALVLAVALVGTAVLALRARAAARRADQRSRAAEDRARHTEDLYRAVEGRHRTLKRESDLRDAEDRHMTDHQVPALVQALWEGREPEFPPPLHTTADGGSVFADQREDALQQIRQAAAMVAGRAEEGAKSVVSTITRSMQGLLNDTTNAIDVMLERHDDPGVLADATAIDHASNQLVRRTQIINVLTGSWPGRQRRSAPLLDVVRGGVSKIRDYDRIKITGAPSYHIVSQAVEPVVLAVAELLDNAARHSEPGSHVQVWFVQAHNGVTVMIDDSGVGLTREMRDQAGRRLRGEEEVRLTRMGSRPKFGFAAVGVLARRYGFRASVDQESIYGGVRAGVFLPSALLTTVQSDPHRRSGRPAVGTSSAVTSPADEPPAVADAAVPSVAPVAQVPSVAPVSAAVPVPVPDHDMPPLPTRCPRATDEDAETGPEETPVPPLPTRCPRALEEDEEPAEPAEPVTGALDEPAMPPLPTRCPRVLEEDERGESAEGRDDEPAMPPLPTRCPRALEDDEEADAPDGPGAVASGAAPDADDAISELPALARTSAPLPAESRPRDGGETTADTTAATTAAESSPGAVPGTGTLPAPAHSADDEPLPARSDGLPQRRRRSRRPSLAEGAPAARPPINSGRTLGAFARGIRSAQERRTTDERTTEQ